MEELLNKIVVRANLFLATNNIELPDLNHLSPIFYYTKKEINLYQRNLAYVYKYVQYENNNNYPGCFMLLKHRIHKLFHCQGLSSLEIYNNDLHNKIHNRVNAVMNNGKSYSKNPYTSPVLNLRLKTSKKNISTLFISENTYMEVDPLFFVDKPSFVTCAISIDSINIGKSTNGISIVLEECIIKEKNVTKKQLLKKEI